MHLHYSTIRHALFSRVSTLEPHINAYAKSFVMSLLAGLLNCNTRKRRRAVTICSSNVSFDLPPTALRSFSSAYTPPLPPLPPSPYSFSFTSVSCAVSSRGGGGDTRVRYRRAILSTAGIWICKNIYAGCHILLRHVPTAEARFQTVASDRMSCNFVLNNSTPPSESDLRK